MNEKINSLDNRPLSILMPSYRSHPYTGGQGIYMRLVTKAMRDLGHSVEVVSGQPYPCLLYTSPSPRDGLLSRMPSSA